jgi:hypothetical protein
MKTIYSVLYITLNTALNEKVSIGLIMSNGAQHIFKHSGQKLLALKGLVSLEKYNFAKSYLKSLETDINTSDQKIGLFNDALSKKEWVSEKYINYLANYANNLIQFSESKTIDIAFNTANFKKLFEKYIHVFEEEMLFTTEESIYEKVKTKLYPKIDKRVNLDMTLNATHFENLFAPIEVNFIGINGAPVAGQTIKFDKQHYNLENDVARFVSLTKAIEIEGKQNGKYYILGREPENNGDKNHMLWEQIRDSDFLDFVDLDDIGMVEAYIEKNDVKPYFTD